MKKTALVAVLIIGLALAGYHVRQRMLLSRAVAKSASQPAVTLPSPTPASTAAPPSPSTAQSDFPVDEVEAEVIRHAKTLPASKLDARLPNEPFETWLKTTLGPDAKLTWESNDCGEFDGSGHQSSVPVCADARAEFTDGRRVSLWIAVGSQALDNATPNLRFSKKPGLWWATVSFRNDEFSCRLQLSYLKEAIEAELSSTDATIRRWCSGHLPPADSD